MVIGAYFGAKISIPLAPIVIRRIYASFLILVAARMMVA